LIVSNIKSLAVLSLGLLALSSCANQPQAEKSKAMIFTVADTGTTTTLNAGQSFEVKLLGTPTAGYSWEVQTLPAGVVLVDKTSEPWSCAMRGHGSLRLESLPNKSGKCRLW
jgi:hypothetical protein